MKTKFFIPVLWLVFAAHSFSVAHAETKAYWRFEDGIPGEYAAVGRGVGGDSVGANALAVYARETRPLYSGDVPFGAVPQTSAINTAAAQFFYSEDFFVPDAPIGNFDFGPRGSGAWTVELSFKMTSVDGVSRLFGRDGIGAKNALPDVDTRGPLQIVAVGNNDKFDVRVEILDGSNTFHAAVSPSDLRVGQWMNLAATADKNTLKLYLDRLDGKGYQLVAQQAIQGALSSVPGIFSVGRGFDKRPSGQMSGLLDEIRLSDAALAPAQFLFSDAVTGAGIQAPSAFYRAPAPITIFSGADPDAAFFGGKFWMVTTAQNSIGRGNPVLHAFSSPDLKNWTKSAQPIFQFKDAPWIAANGRTNNGAWAPTMAEKDGKYYLYYSVGPQNAQGPARIGVAVSDAPDGQFVDSGKALITGEKGFEAIDPMVFRDPVSGVAYIYAGGSAYSKLRIWEMAPDMINLAREIPVETPPKFTEGPTVHAANGQYYLSYSHGDYKSASYSVHYATSNTPVGPWRYRGAILRSDRTRKGPGHHGLFVDPRSGQWIIIYHRWQSPDNGNPFKAPRGRSINIQPVYYDSTGAILPIEMNDDVPILLMPPTAATAP